MRVRDLVKLLEADGWYFTRQSGSHRIFSHKVKKGIVVVPVHGGDIPKGTLKAILKQAGIKAL